MSAPPPAEWSGFLLPPAPIERIADFLAAGGGSWARAGTRSRRGGDDRADRRGRAARPRRRGFPTGRKWASVRDGGAGSALRRGQRRRGRAGDVQGPRADAAATRTGSSRVRRSPPSPSAPARIYLATKRSYRREVDALRARRASSSAEPGLLQELSVTIVEGPDEYLFGEEKALLEVIEGRDPLPRCCRRRQHGLFATALADRLGGRIAPGVSGRRRSRTRPWSTTPRRSPPSAHILANGADWFRTMGTAGSPGTIIATVVGDVRRPGVHEVEMGTPFADAARTVWRPAAGRSFKAAFSGVSNPVLAGRRASTRR